MLYDEMNQTKQVDTAQETVCAKRKKSLFKIILITAAILLILSVGIAVVFNDHVRINFSENETEETVLMYGSELKSELAANGFDGVVLPEVFYSNDSKIEMLDCYDYGNINTAKIFMTCSNMYANIYIHRYKSDNMISHTDLQNVTSEIIKVEMQSADIYCCEQEDVCSLNYRIGLDVYSVLLYNTTLEKATELAKTIQ